jgi:NAD(P)-dependent dehydrogenase (short-subunit alcohol dehydrogenase family)
MKKSIVVFGAYGALGSGVIRTLLKKDYEKYFLFDFDAEQQKTTDNRVININSGDLSIDKNVEEVFRKIDAGDDSEIFLFSTIGGYMGGKEIYETAPDDLERMLNINLRANFNIARHFVKKFGGRNAGGICFTSAYSSFTPEKGKSAYGLSKIALNYLIETLAIECEEKSISVNGIAPYIIDTPDNRKWMKDYDFEKMQKPEEIGALVDYIFSAGNYISGNIISLKIRFRR